MAWGSATMSSELKGRSLRVVTERLSETSAELLRSSGRLATLVAMNVDLALLDDPVRLMESLCSRARDLIGAPCTIVVVRHDDDAMVRHVFVQGLGGTAAAGVRDALLRHDPFPASGAQPLRRAIALHPGWPAGLPASGSLLLVPIRSSTRTYGWTCCLTEQRDDPFSDEDEHLLSTLGLLAGRIYEDRRLYVDVQRHAAELASQMAEKEQAQQRLDTQYAVARILAETSSLDEAAPALLETICRRLDFHYGILREIDRSDRVLVSSTIWHEPDAALAAFADHSRERAFSAGTGMTGTAWTTGRPVWIADCQSDPQFTRREDAAAAGLRVAAAFPVFARGEIVGVLGFIGRTARQESPATMELFSALGSQIGQFVERRRQDAEITSLNRLYAVLSGVNELARHARAPNELFEGICRIVVDRGNLGLAAIGTYDAAKGEIDLIAGAGEGIDGLIAAPPAAIHQLPPERRDEVARAVLERRPAVNVDLAATPELGGPRRRSALRLGYRASVAMPLLLDGRVHGVLVLFSRDKELFTDRYLSLLNEVARDISYALDHLASRDRLAYLAHHDPLTGLPNRALFQERLGQALIAAGRSGMQVAVLFIDIRRFQQVNDTLGREAGDAVLCEFARRLLDIAHNPENLARIEGDRFATFVAGATDAVGVANRIEQASQEILRAPFMVKGHSVQIAGAVGIAIFPNDGGDVETLLRNVEAAIVNAKSSGRDYLFYEPSLNARVAETLRLQGRLKQAADRGEFELHYQPKVASASGRIRGVEALLRWRDPDRGPVSPADFIPVLEESGLIHQVGGWVMRQALVQQRAWLAAGRRPPQVAVNVSAVQFQSAGFIDMVRGLIDEFPDLRAAGGASLDIEITESMVMQDIPGNVARLEALRGLGVSVAIDDFGTGYSSLAYLSRLPIQALKIDRSFISLLGLGPEHMTIVSTIISLAHALGLEVIAEGVETEAQARVLCQLDCDQMQGFLFHRPLPADDLARLLEPA